MNLLEQINNCKEEELTSIIDNAIQNAVTNSKETQLGFANNKSSTSKILPHKGFISPNSRIRYCNISMNDYSMKTTDYIYEFAQYIKENKINNKESLISSIEPFINKYFGISKGKDKRDTYFDQMAFQTTNTDEEYFEKLENLEIGDLKGKNIAMCTERSAIAQNLLSLFGFESYYCIGCINNNGKEEPHCFNIARAQNCFVLLDYSVPITIFEEGKENKYVPFQAVIPFDEIENVLLESTNKTFQSYQYLKTSNEVKRKLTGQFRTYNVGNTTFKQIKSKRI